MASNKHTSAARESLLFLGVLAAIFVVLNFAAAHFSTARVDLTNNKLFSLAEGSKAAVSGLTDPLEITAYFSKDLPAPFNSTERHVRDLLAEYRDASSGKVVVHFINPDTEEKEEEATNNGVQKVAHQRFENDNVDIVNGFRGIVIKYLDEKKVLPAIQNSVGLEYELTSAIKEVAGKRATIAVVQGFGSASLSKELSVLKSALALYEMKEISADSEIDPTLAAVLLVNPSSELSDPAIANLQAYVNQGGALGVLGGTMTIDFETGPTVNAKSTRVNDLLKPWGVEVGDGIVMDANCLRMPISGPGGFPMIVPFPPIMTATLTDEQQENPVMFHLGTPRIPFVSPVKLTKATAPVEAKVLVSSSQSSWIESSAAISIEPRPAADWTPTSNVGPFPVGATIELTESGAHGEGRVLVFGSGYFMDNALQPDQQQGHPNQGPSREALGLALNVIDWLAADADLVAIRAKTIEEPSLNIPDAVLMARDEAAAAVENQDKAAFDAALEKRKSAMTGWQVKKSTYRWGLTLGLPLAVALFGVIRWRMRGRRNVSAKP